MVLTMAAVADNKNIRLDTVDVHIDYQVHTGIKWLSTFKIRIDLDKDLTGREKTILFNSARHCEVSKMLAGECTFDYELTPSVS